MKCVAFLLALLGTSNLVAQVPDYGQAATLNIWDNASAPHSNGITTPETETEPQRVGNTSQAVLYLFPADSTRATGQAVVICPGGGYARLAMDHEGWQMARWFASEGITAAVLKYRLPNTHPEVPLEDVRQALRIMGGLEAGATGFTPEQVGVVGCSAGGHLAAMASTLSDHKPAFAILFYPVISSRDEIAHKGSFDRLLGEDRTSEQSAVYSLENQVSASTPPTLLLLSNDDRSVPSANSTAYYDALKRHDIPASIHIYPEGGHGWGCRDAFRYKAQWQEAVLDFLKARRPKSVLETTSVPPSAIPITPLAPEHQSTGSQFIQAAVQATASALGAGKLAHGTPGNGK